MLPDAWELLARVRDELPAVAVIVTEDALVVCQVSVTLCPLLIEVLFAENVSVGEPLLPGWEITCDPQPVNVAKSRTAENRTLIKQIVRAFIEVAPKL